MEWLIIQCEACHRGFIACGTKALRAKLRSHYLEKHGGK